MFSCFHRLNGMGTGRPDADFENIETQIIVAPMRLHSETNTPPVSGGAENLLNREKMAEMAISPHHNHERVAGDRHIFNWPYFVDGIHRHREQDHRDDRPPAFQSCPECSGFRVATIQVVTSMNSAVILFSLLISIVAFTAQNFITMPLKPSRAPEIVAEEGFGNRNHRDDRRHPGNHRRVKVVRQVRKDGDVLCFRFRQVFPGRGQHAAEHEEHHGQHHHNVGKAQDTEHLRSASSPYSSRFATAKRR